jgi:hypothetical protein
MKRTKNYMTGTTLRLKGIEYHRNGVAGEGFHVVLFTEQDGRNKATNMIATVFPVRDELGDMDCNGRVAVLDRDFLAIGLIAHPNRFRGDCYEKWLRQQIADDTIRLTALSVADAFKHDAERNTGATTPSAVAAYSPYDGAIPVGDEQETYSAMDALNRVDEQETASIA